MMGAARSPGASDDQAYDPHAPGREDDRDRDHITRTNLGRGQAQPLPRAGQYRSRGPRGYQRSDDRVREDVCERLTEDPHIDASDIEVAVADGEVTLGGSIKSRMAKRYVEDLVETVRGVRQVQNNLRIQPRASVLMGAGRTTGRSGGQTGGGSTPTII